MAAGDHGGHPSDLGVDEVCSEVLPEDKDAKVAELQAGARRWPWSATG